MFGWPPIEAFFDNHDQQLAGHSVQRPERWARLLQHSGTLGAPVAGGWIRIVEVLAESMRISVLVLGTGLSSASALDARLGLDRGPRELRLGTFDKGAERMTGQTMKMWAIETDDATFAQDVIERSKEVPVVVDFWAEGCQPCLLVGPILERLATEFDGKFVLVKADLEQTPAAAQRLGVSTIPAVYGFRDGEVRDFFVGAWPERQLHAWIERLLPTEAEQRVAECRLALQSHAEDPSLQLKLAEALAGTGQYQEALAASLALVQDHKQQFGEPARRIMVDIFQVLPKDSELTSTYRRELAEALY